METGEQVQDVEVVADPISDWEGAEFRISDETHELLSPPSLATAFQSPKCSYC